MISLPIAALVLVCLSSVVRAQIRFDLPAQPLAQALTAVGSLANLNIYFDAPTVDGIQAPALKAQLSADEALARLLAGTRLHAVHVDANTIRVVAETEPKHAQTGHAPLTDANSRASVHLASADGSSSELPPEQPVDQHSKTNGEASISNNARVDEVIVTAEKRNERLQDTPVPVAVINATDLVSANQLRLQDYSTSVPGFTVTPAAGISYQALSIRGITTGAFSNPTVGITVDDVPYGASTSVGGGGGTLVPDLDPGDLARVEVLRGPQGTLYGASSLGGLVKFVTVDPSTETLSGRAEAGTSKVQNGPQLGFSARGSINIPLSDTWAVRLSAFTRKDPGFIDNVQTGQRGVNEQRVSGGRLSALWKPSDSLSVKLSALFQDYKGDAFNDVDVGLGDLQQSYLRGAGSYDRKIQAYSATLTTRLGAAELTSITGYNVNSFSDTIDYTNFLGSAALSAYGVGGASLPEDNRTNKFSQELRLSAPLGTVLEGSLGAFYTYERSHYHQKVLAVDPASGTAVAEGFHGEFEPTFTEAAVFADLTVHITDHFDIQFGGRESQIHQTYSELDVGPFVPDIFGVDSPKIVPETDTKGNAFTYLVTPRLKLSQDLMLYARIASGYRSGGANIGGGGGSVAPLEYKPDKTQNSEIGFKGTFLDGALSVDSSIYNIDWKHIQVSLYDPASNISYIANGPQARSRGIELAADARPLRGLSVSAWVTWNEAVLTQSFPATSLTYGNSGDRLPYSSHFSGHLSVHDEFPLGARLSGFVSGSGSYVGPRQGEFTGTSDRERFASYVTVDFTTGAKYADWTLNLFANNVTDRRAALYGGLGSFPGNAFIYIQPRTVGLSVIRAF
jgi:outer membrane receptor protein involved in Fe transport